MDPTDTAGASSEAGQESGIREPHGEGRANHLARGSCVPTGNHGRIGVKHTLTALVIGEQGQIKPCVSRAVFIIPANLRVLDLPDQPCYDPGLEQVRIAQGVREMSRSHGIMRILAFLKAIVEGFRVAPQRPDIPEGVMTLQINAAKWIPNPSDDQILNELARLRDEDGDSFAILGATDLTYIQAAGDARVGFELEYQEGDIDAHFRATDKKITLAQVVKAFTAFRDGNPAWRSSFTFEKMTL